MELSLRDRTHSISIVDRQISLLIPVVRGLARVFALLATITPAQAAEEIVVMALSDQKAILRIDGNQHVLRIGQTTPEGLRVLDIDGDKIVVEWRSQVQEYRLGAHFSSAGTPSTAPEHRIYAGRNGQYRTPGSINGRLVDFLVDTGADNVIVNAREGKRLGIDFRMQGRRVQVMTASGIELGYQIELSSVKVGDIELRSVDAVVIDGGFPPFALLGMSFLGRLELERKGKVLLLRKQF